MGAFRECLQLFSVFFFIGSVTFGGGLAMLPILERELIKKRGWMTSEELVDYFAIGQVTPGIVAVNVATFIGHKRKGIPGAFLTTAGVVAPSVIVITALAMFLENFAEILWVQRALRGINVVVAVLLVSAVWGIGKKTVYDRITAAVACGAFVAIAVFDVPALFVVLISAVLGLLVKFRDWRPRGPRPPDAPISP